MRRRQRCRPVHFRHHHVERVQVCIRAGRRLERLLAWRDGGAMALLLALHLGVVMAFFLTLPYGKFAHGAYRSAALLKWAIEKRQPSRLQLDFE